MKSLLSLVLTSSLPVILPGFHSSAGEAGIHRQGCEWGRTVWNVGERNQGELEFSGCQPPFSSSRSEQQVIPERWWKRRMPLSKHAQIKAEKLCVLVLFYNNSIPISISLLVVIYCIPHSKVYSCPVILKDDVTRFTAAVMEMNRVSGH